MNEIQLGHVALLVPSVVKASNFLRQFNFEIGPLEEWDSEGTKEIYIEKNKVNSLLLMEPFKEGSYKRALEKRGPGFHHQAIDVLSLDIFLKNINETGWLLHPASIQAMKKFQTIYLARPGFPALIEVHEKKELIRGDIFVSSIFLPFDEKFQKLLRPISCEQLIQKTNNPFSFVLKGHQIQFSDLL